MCPGERQTGTPGAWVDARFRQHALSDLHGSAGVDRIRALEAH
jgi:hypothetical protein